MARWSRFAPAADRRLVKGLHDGDGDAVAALYDAYAERLYDYCMILLDESNAACDVVHDTFIDAARRTPRMRERTMLGPWLYAAARRRCLLRKQQQEPKEDGPLSRLDFTQREALFLAYRHDITGDQLAATLGVSARRAQKRLQRGERQVPTAGEFLEKASTPVLPVALRHRVVHTGTDTELAGYRAEIAARGGTLTPDGMPRQPDAPSPLARRWVFASAGSLTALASAVVALLMIGPGMPVPDLHWPGERTNPPSHRHRHHPKGSDPADGNDPRQGVPPRSAPQLIPSPNPPSNGMPSPSPVGALAVSPGTVRLRWNERTADLSLTARGGSVSWSASTTTPQVTLSKTTGDIGIGDRRSVQVILQRGIVTLAGNATINLTDGAGHSTAVTITWDGSLF